MISAIIIHDIGSLFLFAIGVIVCFCIVLFIMRQLAAPPIAYTILYVATAIIGLLLAVDFFFGGGSGTIRIYN